MAFPDRACIHDLIGEQATRHPDDVAAVLEEMSLTYGVLEARANQLAHHLGSKGLGPDSIVALASRPSFEMLVGLLGILKCGAAYLPLDPDHPAPRLEWLLRDARPSALVLVAEPGLWVSDPGMPTIDLRAGHRAIDRQPVTPPTCGATSRHLAYVLYTSGSTGHPKGVLIEHQGLCNMARCHAREFGIRRGSRVLQFASLTYDASVSEIFTTLASGATLVLAPRDRLIPGRDLIDTLREAGITNVLLPPSVLTVLPDATLPLLETVVSGGERCPVEVVKRWAPGRQLFNAYGPTETTVTATLWKCSEQDERDPPIGRPRDNARIYLLDERGEPVPVGATGELCVGGVGLARGYLNRPALTAERFVGDPFAGISGARMYRTGDLARWRDDGAIEFVGRSDRQVKVRGHRIEPGEIEATLRLHPDVVEAVVVAEKGILESTRLVAHCQIRPTATLTTADLRRWLDLQVPSPIIPAVLHLVDAFPLTRNGKIDLASLASARPVAGRGEAAATPIEVSLERIWCDVLGLDRVSRHDQFIEMGGDSLLSVRVADLAEAAGLPLTPRQVLEHPTVAEQAALVEAHRPARDGADGGSEGTHTTPEPLVSSSGRPPANDYPFWCPRFWHGMRVGTYLGLLRRHRFRVDLARWPLALGVIPYSIVNSVLAQAQDLLYGRRIARTPITEPPVFVIGHFRSGTTHLFELLACDDRFAVPTTSEAFTPGHFLLTGRILPSVLRRLLPAKRPMDDMAAGPDRPQEEEFALLVMGAPTLYERMAFPNDPPCHLETIDLHGIRDEDLARLKAALLWFVRAQTFRKRKRLVLKSPVHTGRIRLLADMFPGARFVHISRDPCAMFASLRFAWRALDLTQGLQVPRYENLDDLILTTLDRMYASYLAQRATIDPAQICEIRYEDLIVDPIGQVRGVYERLDLGEFEHVHPALERHLASLGGYRTNGFELEDSVRTMIERRWSRYCEAFGYGRFASTGSIASPPSS